MGKIHKMIHIFREGNIFHYVKCFCMTCKLLPLKWEIISNFKFPLLYKCIHSDIFGAGLFLAQCMAKVWVKKNKTHSKNWPSVKHPQFWFYSHETWWKWLPHEVVIFTKFQDDRTENVDFLLLVKFECVSSFFLLRL